METDVILLNEFCSTHQVEISFIRTLEENGMIETVTVDQSKYINTNELPKLERIIRLHRELNINPEGIDVINELLNRLDSMQQQMNEMKNRLDFYTKGN
ncbi:MAG: chaperone modulator CbpM [Bacteroidetes bacterium]|nr:chaperone modulator CbpM [Bacteroidota bacterium]MBS1931164.1 chaperone modulator CbpM [Bacteroidota bacterium]